MHEALGAVDWDAEGRAALGLLQDLVRFDTSNPPGDEGACAELVAAHLRASGLDVVLLADVPGRPNVVARLGGGPEPPLMLSAHLDVVPAEPERWTHPPFGGEVHDGWLWGRGAVDMKHMAAMSLVTARLLARTGAPLRRDLVVTAVVDEEDGCAHGSRFLVREHPEAVRAGFVLGEVGGFPLHVGGRVVYPVQVAEKGACWLRATAHGPTGHGSIPRQDNAVVRLGAFLQRLGRTRLPVHPSPQLEAFVEGLGAVLPPPARALLPLLLRPRASPALTRALGRREPALARLLDAVVRNTATPTRLAAGTRVNVVPGEASADLDGRIAVGSSEEELVAEVRALAGQHVRVDVVRGGRPPTAHPVGTDLFTTIAEVVGAHHHGATAVPTVVPGFTDAHFWAELGAVCYGFTPVVLQPGGPAFADLFHGDDERIPVGGFTEGLRMLADVVARFCLVEGLPNRPGRAH